MFSRYLSLLVFALIFFNHCFALQGGCGNLEEYTSLGHIDLNGLEGSPGGTCTFDENIGFPYMQIQTTPHEGCYLIEDDICYINAAYVVKEQNFAGYTQCGTTLGSFSLAINTTTFDATIISQTTVRNYNDGSYDWNDPRHYSLYGTGGQKNVFYGDSTYVYTNLVDTFNGIITYCAGSQNTPTNHTACNTSTFNVGSARAGCFHDNGVYSQKHQFYFFSCSARTNGPLQALRLSDMTLFNYNSLSGVHAIHILDEDDVLFVVYEDEIEIYDISDVPSSLTLIDSHSTVIGVNPGYLYAIVNHPDNKLIFHIASDFGEQGITTVKLNADFTIDSVNEFTPVDASGTLYSDALFVTGIDNQYLLSIDVFNIATWSYCLSSADADMISPTYVGKANIGPGIKRSSISDKFKGSILIPNFPGRANQIFISGRGAVPLQFDDGDYGFSYFGNDIGTYSYCGSGLSDESSPITLDPYICGDTLDTLGPCCDYSVCNYTSVGTVCNATEECQISGTCSGNSIMCSATEFEPEGTSCLLSDLMDGICSATGICISPPAKAGCLKNVEVGEACSIPNGKTGVCSHSGSCIQNEVEFIPLDLPMENVNVFRENEFIADSYSTTDLIVYFVPIFGSLVGIFIIGFLVI